MNRIALLLCLILLLTVPAHPWKNGGDTKDPSNPLFGTHDYIAYKGYRLAGASNVPWVRYYQRWYFLGTEAPDTGAKVDSAENGYRDTLQCHCILFDSGGGVTRDRAELRVRQEFDKARAALAGGDRRMAAFYAGAMAHYIADLSQFCHVMGAQSHWGTEDKKVHGDYEIAVEKTIDFGDRSSSLLDGYIHPVQVSGNTPEEIARAAASFTERGSDGRNPRWMHQRYEQLTAAKKHLKPNEWDQEFRDQTGENVNHAANAIAKLLLMIGQP